MRLTENILDLAKVFGAQRKLSPKTLSMYVFKSTFILDRLSSGGDITTRSYERALQWFSDRWPEDVSWPDHIERPVQTAVAHNSVSSPVTEVHP